MPILQSFEEVCEVCQACRQAKERFPKKSHNQVKKVMKLIHSSLVGPLPKASINGSCHVVVFTCDFSSNSWVCFIKSKSKTLNKFKVFQALMEAEIGEKITMLRTNHSGEYHLCCLGHIVHKEAIDPS